MSNIYIINAHHVYPFSGGRLNESLTEKARTFFEQQGHQVKTIQLDKGWDTEEEVANHVWADVILVQAPVNWMSIPWTFKKYQDDVYTAGMDGRLCNGDGRTATNPTSGYGTGGALAGKHYMLSLTFNAPEQAFSNPDEYLFEGKNVDDLFMPQHMNFRFFGMKSLPTFVCYDVMKNPDIENDFIRFEQHLTKVFS